MINYLHRINLAAAPGEGGSGNAIKLTAMVSCLSNFGDAGQITANIIVENQDAVVNVTVFEGSDNSGNAVASATLNSNNSFSADFPMLNDGTYFVFADYYTVEGQTFNASKVLTVNCFRETDQPADYVRDYEILLEKIYSNPRGNDQNPFLVDYDVRVWKFNKNTETWYLTNGVVTLQNGTPSPLNFLVTDPFYSYCVPNTTTRRDFNYTHEGKVTKVDTPNSDTCGFVNIPGCTDPTATNYNPNATVDNGSCYFRPQKFGCTDPVASNYDPEATDENGTCQYEPMVREAILGVSPMNSIRFVLMENIDGNATLQTLDNVLFCQERFRGIRNVGYMQKVALADQHIYQFRSNFASLSLDVIREDTGAVVDTITPTMVVQNAGETKLFPGYMKNNSNGQTRIYFNTGGIPVPVSIGDRFTLMGETVGTYTIADIKQDAKAGSAYIVFNHPFTSGSETVPAFVRFQLSNAEYDVLEATVAWADYPSGRYYMTLTGNDPSFETAMYTSEPISLKLEHPDTLVVEYRNFDNAFDMIYTTGIINRIRVEGEMRKRIPGGETILHREPQNEITRLLGIPYRMVKLTTWNLPAWLHEKMHVILMHDHVEINGVAYQSEEGYEEPEYNDNTALSNSGAIMEQKMWFREHNGHDLGSIDQQPLLIIEGGFLRL